MPNNTKKTIEVYFIDKIPLNVQNYLINNLSHLENVKLNFIDKVQEEYILENISEAHIIIGWRPTLKMLEKADNLKLVINPGAGIRHLLDIFREINKKRKINLVNGHGNSYFVAQHAVALLLSLMNKIIPHHEWMKEGKWRTGDKEGASIPLRFRKVGLFGYGAINQKVHQMLAGFEVEFSILRKHWDKQTQELITPAKKYQPSQFHDFLKEIDILIIAVPATTITEGIIQQKELELLGPNALIVNVARGEIINEANLYNSLKENVIAGAAIDVWYNYDPQNDENGKKYPYNFPFHNLNNIILSPHRGYSPFSDLLRWNEVIENISRMSQGRNDFVNLVSLEDEY